MEEEFNEATSDAVEAERRQLGDAVAPEQIQALEAGVDFVAYESAFFRFVDCVERSGIQITVLGLNSERQLYEFEVLGTATEDPSIECYNRHLALVDTQWQGQQEARFADEVLADQVAQMTVLRRCLIKAGLDPPEFEAKIGELPRLVEWAAVNGATDELILGAQLRKECESDEAD